jgi:hydroxymethylpyrimidine/phosphomethylpyrimidine kinase
VKKAKTLSPQLILDQLEAIIEDLPPKAVKIGMLGSEEVVSSLSRALESLPGKPPVILDPVMVAKSGARLLDQQAIVVLRERLLPACTLLTPNFEEALWLTDAQGIPQDENGLKELGERILGLGAKAVLVKGGHLKGEYSIDWLFWEGKAKELVAPRVPPPHGHGTGCTLSAAIAAFMALGEPLESAVAHAKDFVYLGLLNPACVGKGFRPLNVLSRLERETDRYFLIERLKVASRRLMAAELFKVIPEVGTNLVEALPYASTLEEVAGFPARIIKTRHGALAPLGPEFGGSDHMGRLILTLMKTYPDLRAAMNLAYSKRTVKAFQEAGLSIKRLDRKEVSPEIEEIEGRTIPALVKLLTREGGGPGDAFYDGGGLGKEPMIRLVGYDAMDVTDKLLRVLSAHP